MDNPPPLLRPSIKALPTSKNQSILIDTSHTNPTHIRIAAVGRGGHFSSKILDSQNITAIVTEQAGAGLLTAQDVKHALSSSGVGVGAGIVVVRAGKRQRVEAHDSDVLEIETDSDLLQDHVLHLLSHATESCHASIHNAGDMLKGFVKTVKVSFSRVQAEKAAGVENPVVVHGDGEAVEFESAKLAVERESRHVLSQVHKAQIAETKDVVYSVHLADVNGLSRLEVYILVGEIARYLDSQNVPYTLDDRGFKRARTRSKPKVYQQTSRKNENVLELSDTVMSSQISLTDVDVRKRIQAGCNALIKAERTITEYDTIVGDGDCGYTLRDGAKKVLSFIDGRDLSKLPEMVAKLVQELEVSMGGTSGALYCIYLTALARTLALERSVPNAMKAALEQLYTYTNARVGDRTIMDVLVPFTVTLAETGDVKPALGKAADGVEKTKTLRATLGRSAYLDDKATQGVPDPGAYGLNVLLSAMSNS